MANLAIKGHATRGKEVIEILEMLGGVNELQLDGFADALYIISDRKIRINIFNLACCFEHFTLEEFLEKFPYKVGDKVKVKETGKDVIIDGMSWRNGCEVIYDTCYNNDCVSFYSAEELQPYKEETMEDIIKIDIPKGYEFAGVDDDNQQVVFEKIGYHYPKTYEECCEIMGIEYPFVGGKPDGLSASTYRITEIRPFIYLLICRDTYWKIAGWNPKVKSDVFYMHTLPSYLRDLFPMPTEEMRDAFYENFKDLIEQCKKLL